MANRKDEEWKRTARIPVETGKGLHGHAERQNMIKWIIGYWILSITMGMEWGSSIWWIWNRKICDMFDHLVMISWAAKITNFSRFLKIFKLLVRYWWSLENVRPILECEIRIETRKPFICYTATITFSQGGSAVHFLTKSNCSPSIPTIRDPVLHYVK